MPETCREEK